MAVEIPTDVNEFPYVRVIVVNYDGGEITIRCLRALEETNWPKQRLEIVLVDNASIDGLDWKIPKLFPDIKLIKSLTNEGFARGNNLAMQDLDGIDFIALINNDTVPQSDWLIELYKVAGNDDRIAGVGSKMLFNKSFAGLELNPHDKFVCLSNIRVNKDDSLHLAQFDERFDNSGIGAKSTTPQHWFSQACSFSLDASEFVGESSEIEVELFARETVVVSLRSDIEEREVTITSIPQRFSIKSSNSARVINNAGEGIFHGLHGGDIGFKELDLGQYEETKEVFGFCGGAALLRTRFLEEVGLFDPTFFLYYEDIDLAWRGRLRGWKFFYAPKSVVLHEHSYSSGAGSQFVHFWADRNRRLTLVKNAPARQALRAVVGSIAWAIRDALINPVKQVRKHRGFHISHSVYRARQLGSFLKVLPSAVRQRNNIEKARTKPREIVFDWLSVR